MTAIIGIKHNGKTYLASDALVMDGMDVKLLGNGKIFRVGDILFGVTGLTAMLSVLQHVFSPPTREEGMTDMQYLAGPFLEAVWRVFEKRHLIHKGDEEHHFEGMILLGYRGKLYTISVLMEIAEIQNDFVADGCGGHICTGVLWATRGSTDIEQRIHDALRCAEIYSSGVSGPFFFIGEDDAAPRKIGEPGAKEHVTLMV